MNSKIEELMLLAQQKETESRQQKQQDSESITKANVDARVEKIYSDRTEQGRRHEERKSLALNKRTGEEKTSGLKKQLEGISTSRTEISKKLEDPEVGDGAKEVYRQILVELNNQEKMIRGEFEVAQQEITGVSKRTEENEQFIKTTNEEAAEAFSDPVVRDRIRSEADAENDILKTEKEIKFLSEKIEEERSSLKMRESFIADTQPLRTAWWNFTEKARELGIDASNEGPLIERNQRGTDVQPKERSEHFALESLTNEASRLRVELGKLGKAGLMDFDKKKKIKELQARVDELNRKIKILNPFQEIVYDEVQKFHRLHREETDTRRRKERTNNQYKFVYPPSLRSSSLILAQITLDVEDEARKIRDELVVDEKELTGLQEKLTKAQQLKNDFEKQLDHQ